ncbi:MAG: hypothetical protein HY747_09575 [Elusimicrobia bacterium]|nr:hypothetical protein [Elusimicrobiota bacterium]
MIHWPLLAHPDPKNICLLGATSGLLLDEIFKHPVKSAIIIEPDRQAVDFLKAAMGSGLHPASQSFGDGAMTSGHGRLSFVSRDLRAAKGSLQQMTVQQAVPGRRPGANEDLTPWRVENQDPLKWLKTHPQTCDVIVHDVGQPANAASNRLFTKEFYLAAQKALKAGGILAFSIVGSENYMSPQTAYLDASVMKTVKSVFRSVEIVPGSRMVILAGHEPIALESNRLAQRYAKRKINNQVIVPSNFPFFLDNWRREVFLKRVGELSRVPENKDLFPVSYFYAWRMWLSQVVSPKELTGLVLICVVILAAGLKLKKSWTGVSKSPAAAYLGLLGFFAMTCEVVFLLGFQAMSGALFWQMGLLFAMFMAGLCLGSLMGGLIQATAGRAVLLAIFCALFAVAAGRLLPLLNAISAIALLAVFAGLLLICGAAVGLAFVFSVSLETDSSGQSIGLLYGADLWGSAAGAFVTSGLLIPILGMERTLLAAGFAAAAAGLWIAVKNDKFR